MRQWNRFSQHWRNLHERDKSTNMLLTERPLTEFLLRLVLTLLHWFVTNLAILPSLALLIYAYKNEAALSAASGTTTAPDTTPPSLPSTRSSTHPMNWEACMFCQNASDMSKMSSDQLANIRLSGVIDLIASEGKYHGTCYKQFIWDTSKRKENSKTTDVAMLCLTDELRCADDQGLVLELAEVWRHYSSQKTMGFWKWFMLR